MHGSRQLWLFNYSNKPKDKDAILLMSATHSDMSILLQLLTGLSLRSQPRLQVALVML